MGSRIQAEAVGILQCRVAPPAMKMVVKVETSLLPTAVEIPSSERVPMKRTFLWLLTASLVLIFGWLALLSVIAVNNMNIQSGGAEDLFNKFGRSQEVRCLVLKSGVKGK